MPNPTRISINCETKEETIIELTDEEVAEMEAAAAIEEQKREEEKAAKAAATASAVAKLEAIGLTADEIAALRG
jgi:hypothetical protein